MSGRKCRFYVPGGLTTGRILELPEDEARHASQVLRLAAGEGVELFDGDGAFAPAVVTEVKKRRLAVEIGKVDCEPPRVPRITLAFAVPKGKRLDWLLEKATEMGAWAFQPVIFERSVAGGELSENKRSRWEAHIVAAAKQCGRSRLPELREPASLEAFLETSNGEVRLAGDITPRTLPLSRIFTDMPEAVTVIVGPEGGFTELEREMMERSEVQPVRLGQTVLRIETACVALLAGLRVAKEFLA